MRDSTDLIERVSQLRARSADIAARMRRDSDQLADIHHELSDVLSRLQRLYETAMRARAPAPAVADAGTRSPLRMLRLAEVTQRLGLSRSSVWRMVKDGEFPKPRRLSSHAVAWPEAEILDWLAARPAFDERAPRKPKARRSERRDSTTDRRTDV